MNFKICTDDGYTEAIIDQRCGCDHFKAIADILNKHFNIIFSDKMGDLESTYWDFDYKGSKLTLHCHALAGLSIYPLANKEATELDNKHVVEIGTLLHSYFTDNDHAS
jgi:hypothetical protein